ncbi:MAG: Heparinase family protein [Paenibacillaceae bacterium]|jgi:hypothetical protein|nr:Heparinase family protein [Paenibacillaceae bacterium]
MLTDSSYLINRLVSVEQVEQLYPDKMQLLLQQTAFKSLQQLLACFRSKQTEFTINRMAYSEETDEIGEEYCNDTFTIYGVRMQMSRDGNGCYDWNTKGPQANYYSWGQIFNRHNCFSQLAEAYQKTGNTKYVSMIDELLRNWIVANPWYKRASYEDVEWNFRPWRSLEAALRIPAWLKAFYAFQAFPELHDGTILLMLSSILEHCDCILNYTSWPAHNYPNIYASEMLGLVWAGVYFQEFRDAAKWIETAVQVFNQDIVPKQVYPDGIQKELSFSYHLVAMHDFQLFRQLIGQVGLTLHPECLKIIEQMQAYAYQVVQPNGYTPLNGDSDHRSIQDEILRSAAEHNRADWLYIATSGAEGEEPGYQNLVYPWGGQAVFRNGYTRDSHWSFFDFGAFATSGHGHRDKLHLSVYNERDILVDSGRYIYEYDEWLMDYFRESSYGHNTVLVNGGSQCEGPAEQLEPETACGENYAMGTYNSGYYPHRGDSRTPVFTQAHTRKVIYEKNRFWFVMDRIMTESNCMISPLWHFHPDCTVIHEGQAVRTSDSGTGNLLIIPSPNIKWDITLIKGQREPYIQGWYSEKYGVKTPAVCAEYSATITDTQTFAWIMLPFGDQVPEAALAVMADGRFRVTYEGQSYIYSL